MAALALFAGCSRAPEEMSADARALCQGEPLGSVERREQALEDGYDVHRRYDCITKASYLAVQRQKAEWDAGHTPEAVAQREREFAAQRKRAMESQAQARAEQERLAAIPVVIDVHPVEANSATEAELAKVVSIDAEIAAQIVAARAQQPFRDWADLAGRVVGLAAAQTAVYASACGLTVDGKSLEGMPPNAAIAAELYKLYHRPGSAP